MERLTELQTKLDRAEAEVQRGVGHLVGSEPSWLIKSWERRT